MFFLHIWIYEYSEKRWLNFSLFWRKHRYWKFLLEIAKNAKLWDITVSWQCKIYLHEFHYHLIGFFIIHIYPYIPLISWEWCKNLKILGIIVCINSQLPSRNILSFVYTMIHLNKFYSVYLFMLDPSFTTQSYLYGGGIKIFWNLTYAIIWSFGHIWSPKMQVFQ